MSLDTINNLLNSLLDISKLESGTVQPHMQKFCINEVLHRVYNTASPMADDKRLKFIYQPCSRVVESDVALLEQLLINLVSNAVRYTPPGGHIVLGCRRRRDFLEIQVLDNGIGIPESEIDNIFDEYVQLEYHGHRSSKGLGLGLAIVKRIVELLGLRYHVRSAVNRGTIFSIFVPLVRSSEHRKTPPEVDGENAGLQARALILLVEDDLAVLQSTALFLEVSGYKVMQARSLQNALQLAEQHTPDLIVSDYGLRDNENGIQVVTEIRKSLGCVVNAVILTGDTSAERAREAADSDCDIIYKPIKSDVLLKWVHRLANKPHRN